MANKLPVGRPVRGGERKTERIPIYVTPSFKDTLIAETERLDIDMAEYVRDAIEFYMNQGSRAESEKSGEYKIRIADETLVAKLRKLARAAIMMDNVEVLANAVLSRVADLNPEAMQRLFVGDFDGMAKAAKTSPKTEHKRNGGHTEKEQRAA